MFVRLATALALFSIGCASDAKDTSAMEGAELFHEVSAILDRSCAKQTCHGDMVMNGYLTFMTGDIRGALVGVPSCEYDRMPRVAPFQPEKSWLMIKLAGPTRFVQYMDFIDFEPDPDWKPTKPECSDHLPDGSPWFGTRMPPMDTTEPPSMKEIQVIRKWIELGAPGGE
jgi:hypothetical protein